MPSKFWKSTIQLEIIGVGNPPHWNDLFEMARATDVGDCSGRWTDAHIVLTEEEFRTECLRQGTDPAFFFGDE